MELTLKYVLIQLVGFAGLASFFLSYQIKSNRMLFLFQTLASALFCVQYLLLGAWSGCLNLLVAIIRNMMLARYSSWTWVRWKGWVWIFTVICTGILILTWQGPLSLLPYFALVGSTIGFWTNNAQKIRLSILTCTGPCWLIYSATVGSIGGFINELITIASIVISIYRYGWKAMGDESSGMNQ